MRVFVRKIGISLFFILIGNCIFLFCYDLNLNVEENLISIIDEKEFEFTYTEEDGSIKIWVTGCNKKIYKNQNISIVIPEQVEGKILKREWNSDKHEWVITSPKNFILVKNVPVYGIARDAFNGGLMIESVVFPKNLISIGSKAFCNCLNLKTIHLPETLKEVYEDAFSGCIGLTSELKAITIDCPPNAFKGNPFKGGVRISSSEGGRTLTADDIVFSKEWHDNDKYKFFPKEFEAIDLEHEIEGPLLYGYEGSSIANAKIYVLGFKNGLSSEEKKKVVLPDTITGRVYKMEGKSSSFWNPDFFIEGVNMPLYGIRKNAFSHSPELEAIIFPDNLSEIGSRAFKNCINLQSITLPKNITAIKTSTFSGCTALKSIVLPETLVEIGYAAFRSNLSLETITIPEGVTMIGDSSFSQCKGLQSIILPESLRHLGKKSFSDCKELKSIKLPGGLTMLERKVFYACRSLKTVILPEDLRIIKPYAFSGCNSLEHVTLPEKLIEIEGGAFAFCESLKAISLPNTLTKIGARSFGRCSGFDLGLDKKKKVIVINCSPDVFEEEVFKDIRGKNPNNDTESLLTEENIEFNHPSWTVAKKKKVFEESGIEFTK